MAYFDDIQRRRRNPNNPVVPLPNYVPQYGSGASVGELDTGIARQRQFNRDLVSPGGLTPYYGTGYTQQAQSSRPMVPANPMPPTPRSSWYSGSPIASNAIGARYGTGNTPGLPATTPPTTTSSIFPFDSSSGYTTAPASAPEVAKPAENATQRWQNFGQTALDRRPAPQPFFTEGQRRRIMTGRIGGQAPQSPNEAMPIGGTSISRWRDIFGSNTSL